jgi:hypothetical protein
MIVQRNHRCVRALVATVAVSALAVSSSAVGDAAALAPSVAPSPVAVSPQLQTLEQKMEQLQVNGESFTEMVQDSGSVTVPSLGGGKPRTRMIDSTQDRVGAVSLVPRKATIASVDGGTPYVREIGSSVYIYIGSIAKRDHGRPWVRLAPALSTSIQLFPYGGGSLDELSDGGSGPYAGLINLLNTATVPVEVRGPALVDSQQTTVFHAVVEPLKLLSSSALKEFADAFGVSPTETLEAFISESGEPVRVIVTGESHTSEISTVSTETTDITAIDPSFAVMAPARRETIDEARLLKLLGPEFGGLLKAITQ